MLEDFKDLERGIKGASDKEEKDMFIDLLKDDIKEADGKVDAETQKLIDKLKEMYLGAEKKETPMEKEKEPLKPKAKPKPKARKKTTPEQKAQNKVKVQNATGKSIEECKEILAKYEALRGKTTQKDKQRVDKLKEEDKIIDGTNVKTADAITETTAKQVPKKIKQEVDAIEKEAEKEAKEEVNPKGKTKAEVKKEVEEVKIEKIEEKVKDMTKDLADKSSELIKAMSKTISDLSPSKDEVRKFLLDIRGQVDVLLKAYKFGGAVQSYNVPWMGGQPMPSYAKGGKFADGGKFKVGDVVEMTDKNKKFGFNSDYYIVEDKVGYDEKDFLISDVKKRESYVWGEDAFERKLNTYSKGGKFADGGKVNKNIALTIIEQMGGVRRLNMFTGAKNFVALSNGVSFRIGNKSINYVKITLNGKDLYDLTFGLIRSGKLVNKKEYNDVFNDQLKSVFEESTGMYLSFAKGGELLDGGMVNNNEEYFSYFEYVAKYGGLQDTIYDVKIGINKDEEFGGELVADYDEITINDIKEMFGNQIAQRVANGYGRDYVDGDYRSKVIFVNDGLYKKGGKIDEIISSDLYHQLRDKDMFKLLFSTKPKMRKLFNPKNTNGLDTERPYGISIRYGRDIYKYNYPIQEYRDDDFETAKKIIASFYNEKYSKGGKFADGGEVIKGFNPKDFSLQEIDSKLLSKAIFLQWLREGDSTYSADKRDVVWNGRQSSTKWNAIKNKRFTMSDYGQVSMDKGSENLYFTVIIYELDGYDPMELQMYSKDNHSDLKSFANSFISKMAKGGSTYGGDGEEYIYPSEEERIDEMAKHWNSEGWASSSVSKQGDDGEFFDKIGVDSDKVGITSQTGNDIIYYDVNRPSYFNRDFAKGGKFADGGKVLMEISTHKAVRNGDKIDIISKGIEIDDLKFNDEKLYSIPYENIDDLLPIFDGLEENNRINLSEYEYKKGGKLPRKKGLGWKRDRERISQEPHEQAYKSKRKGNYSSFEMGGKTMIDEEFSNVPEELEEVFGMYNEDEDSYSEMKRLKAIANQRGYDFDYGLDGEPTEFWEINKMAKGGEVKDEYKDFFKRYEENEENNYHTENAIMLVSEFGTADELKRLMEIQQMHENQGYLTVEQSREQYEIQKPYYRQMFAKGGRTTRAINQDRARLSKEKHEQTYLPKRKGDYSSFDKGGQTYAEGNKFKNNDRAKVRIKDNVKGTQWYSENEEYEVFRWMGDWALANDDLNRGIKSTDAIVIERYSEGGKTDFIQDAVDSPNFREGAFTRKAEARGMSTDAFMNQVLHSPNLYDERTRKQAQFMKNAFND